MKQIQLIWTAENDKRAASPETYFMLAPGLGLTDADLHRVTNANWKNMRASSDTSVASVAVAPQTSMQELQDAIESIATKGGYKVVAVSIRKL